MRVVVNDDLLKTAVGRVINLIVREVTDGLFVSEALYMSVGILKAYGNTAEESVEKLLSQCDVIDLSGTQRKV